MKKLFVLPILALLIYGCSSAPTRTEQGLFNIQTNQVPVVVLSNGVPVNSQAEVYSYTLGPGARNVQEIGTAVGNLFGVGGLVGTGLGALFSLWGWVRSSKKGQTAVTLAESIETMRMFIRQLPNGSVMDNELVNWMQAHQAETGVLNEVMALLSKYVDAGDAQAAAQQVQAVINSLQTPSQKANG